MSQKKKNVGTAGKFGPRYGVKVRKQIQAIEKEKIKRHICPRCKHKSVKRAYTPIQSKIVAAEAYNPTEEEANV
jgi:large subunit ribosomal protein L37Ae